MDIMPLNADQGTQAETVDATVICINWMDTGFYQLFPANVVPELGFNVVTAFPLL